MRAKAQDELLEKPAAARAKDGDLGEEVVIHIHQELLADEFGHSLEDPLDVEPRLVLVCVGRGGYAFDSGASVHEGAPDVRWASA